MTRDRALLIGIAGLIGCVIGVLFAPKDAFVAWRVAWLAWGSIPIGSLAVLMLVALIPGSWRELYVHPLSIGTTLMPLVAIAMIPLQNKNTNNKPKTDPSVGGAFSGFKGAWLSTGFFVIRTIIYF